MLSKSSAKIFFLGGTVVTFLVFIVLSWITLTREVPKNTHSENLTPQVVAGKVLWDKNNCMGCHSILGEGAYYAPELTKVYDRRGEGYIRAVLMAPPPGWYVPTRGRRMVAYHFTDEQVNDLIAFFKWIGQTDLNGFPPKPKYTSTINTQ
jgi:nitric oxide reductase subunit C